MPFVYFQIVVLLGNNASVVYTFYRNQFMCLFNVNVIKLTERNA